MALTPANPAAAGAPPAGATPPPAAAGLPALAQLKDLSLRVPLDPALEREVAAYLGASATLGSGTREHYEQGATLVQRCLDFLEAETSRLTHQRFLLGDAGSIKQKALGEPRRQVDLTINNLKQKLAGEKSEWNRRLTKQAGEVQDSIDKELRGMKTREHLEKEHLKLGPEPEWLGRHGPWLDEVFGTWASHLGVALQGKTQQLIAPDLQTLADQLGTPVNAVAPPPGSFTPPTLRLDVGALEQTLEVPTFFGAFFESFKSGLNTVAMIVGMVVMPVVSLTEVESRLARAAVMTGFIVPVILFAAYEMVRTRQKMVQKNTDAGTAKIAKDMEEYCQVRVERFKAEADRFSQNYLAQATTAFLQTIEPLVSQVFQQREVTLVAELTRVQTQADRLADQLNSLRQVKGGLSGQLLVDMKRKVRELGGAV